MFRRQPNALQVASEWTTMEEVVPNRNILVSKFRILLDLTVTTSGTEIFGLKIWLQSSLNKQDIYLAENKVFLYASCTSTNLLRCMSKIRYNTCYSNAMVKCIALTMSTPSYQPIHWQSSAIEMISDMRHKDSTQPNCENCDYLVQSPCCNSNLSVKMIFLTTLTESIIHWENSILRPQARASKLWIGVAWNAPNLTDHSAK